MERMEVQSKNAQNKSAMVGGAKLRPNFSKDRTQILLDWLEDHAENPWPTKIEKKELCKQTGLTYGQLRIWFTNNRKRKLNMLKNKKSSVIVIKMNNTIKSKKRPHIIDCQISENQNQRKQNKSQIEMIDFKEEQNNLIDTERKLEESMLEMMKYCHCDLFILCNKLNLMNNSFY